MHGLKFNLYHLSECMNWEKLYGNRTPSNYLKSRVFCHLFETEQTGVT